ncbi:xylulokinase [Schlegelella sp. ID0723]|uniref:Xylulose kinase n=1 Tax=Piscinibacter koreensis TaxID=2742824 RepID=A0A7Y6TY90_9BURK|nr:xylulokinase [Schlegelella koreensis]
MTLGIDLGTSAVKALLLDDERIVGVAEAALVVARPQPGWSEQDPDDWWRATCDCLDRLQADHRAALAAVAAIGLSGQMHGATLLDRHGAVLRPCILWNDGRSAAQCAELEARAPTLRGVAGNPAMPGFTAPKLLWVREHEPALFDRIDRVLLPKAWLRWKLCGEFVDEMSDASGTLWLDVGRRRWSDELLAACGLTAAQMPRLVEGNAAAGALRPEWVRRWGFQRAPLLAGGAGDNAAGAVGVGAVRPGDAFVSLGTSGVLWATTAGFAPRPERGVHAFCHAVPDTWHQMGVLLSAAASLAFWSRVSGQGEAALLAGLGARPERPAACWFAPYLAGERTPHNDADVRGGFLALDSATDAAAMTQAVLEGVAYAFRDARDALASAGTRIDEADLIGGGSRSAYWADVLANVLGVPLHQLEGSEVGAALGAARLARMAADGGTLHAARPRRLRSFEPRPALAAQYTEAYARWQALYGVLRQVPPAPPLATPTSAESTGALA